MLDFWDPDQSKAEAVYKELLLLYTDTNNEEREVYRMCSLTIECVLLL